MAVDEREDFKEMELWEHLAELRARLIRSAAYILFGLVVVWCFYNTIYMGVIAPIIKVMKERDWEFVIRHIVQAFTLRLQVSFVAGLVIAIPLVTLEVWGFVAPGLTRQERKACYLIFPLSIFFFFMGVVCGYSIMEPSVRWFADFVPKDMKLQQDPVMWITFMVKMIVAFGVCFQLPIVLMFLAYVGLVSSRLLKEQWRMCVVLCFVVAAVATPGGDPFSMFMMALPLAVLYVASIFLCMFVERIKAGQEKKETSLSFSSAK